MKTKITKEQFDYLLNSFEENDRFAIRTAIRLVTEGEIFSDYTSEIGKVCKQILVRKVLRYIAQTSLKSLTELNVLSVSCSFYEMKDGKIVYFKH